MPDDDDNLPPVTHLQFRVLEIVGAGEVSGKDLRQALSGKGIRKTGPAFYQMMSRLEESKMVQGWYDQKIIDGQIIKERRYKMLGNGREAVRSVAQFYRTLTLAELAGCIV